LAETFIHAGVGQARGGIDRPIARESTTGYPYIAGPSGKGAARDAFRRHWWLEKNDENGQPVRFASPAENLLFGPETGSAEVGGAGELIISDMRLLLMPVRSLNGACRYVTCPELIYRLLADLRRAGRTDSQVEELIRAAPHLVRNGGADRWKALTEHEEGSLYLEELCFTCEVLAGVGQLAMLIGRLLAAGAGMAAMIGRRLTIVSDDAFTWFAENALPTRMRNALENDTSKKVKDGALWSEEYVASDTLMYMLVGVRNSPDQEVSLPLNGQPNGESINMGGAFEHLLSAEKGYLQVGGNETVGHGWFRVQKFAPASPK
jgi:CRISPR-associated protein Cmr4